MRPEPVLAMRNAIALGPDHVPEGLFVGSQAAIFRALRAHANTISHARHVALEDSFPKTRQHMGAEAFHQIAIQHLADPAVLARPLRLIGAGFSAFLPPVAADMADVEWAYLQSHGAREAPALLLADLKDQTPEQLVAMRVTRHPATQLVTLRAPKEFQWDGVPDNGGGQMLVTRPNSDILFARVDRSTAALVEQVENGALMGALLEQDAEATSLLITIGALRPELEIN